MARGHARDLTAVAGGTIARYGMLTGGETVVVGVSGGPDSVAMLLFLHEIARDANLSLRVFHLDHMLRGEDSARDARYVERLARDLGLDALIDAADVRAESRGRRRSPQDIARAVRLERIFGYADRCGADRIALGHTADDQVETFLMRMVQGAGLTGLAAMRPVSGRIVRPLIETWRSEVERYLEHKEIAPRLDRSNLETDYLRNRVRLKLLPAIVSEFGESTKDVILREVSALAPDRDMLQEMARGAAGEIAVPAEGGFRIDREALRVMPASLRHGVIREVWSRLMPGETMLSWRHVTDVMERVVEGRSGASIDLPRGARARREYGYVVIGLREPLAGAIPPGFLHVPGAMPLPGNMVLEAKRVGRAEVAFDRDPGREYARGDLAGPLEVRAPRPGDRFRPLGSAYQRKIKDYFIDVKLPRRCRAGVPLVLHGGEVVWVVGHRLDDRYRLRPEDAEAVMLRLRREDE